MIRALITGTIYGEPQARTSQAGKQYATAKVKADSGKGEGGAVMLARQPFSRADHARVQVQEAFGAAARQIFDDQMAALEADSKRVGTQGGKIDFAMFGCPHLSIRQVGDIARVAEGQKFAVPVWVLTSSLTRELADRMGYLDVITRAGGHIVTDT